MNINKGDAFLCIKDFEMKDGTIAFKKGLIYTSERKDCITNEWKNKDHFMNKLKKMEDTAYNYIEGFYLERERVF